MATFKAIVFQTGRHIKQDGTSNIKIRIYHNRESQYIATSYYIRPENMDDSGRILPNVPNSEMIEYEINAYIQKIRREYLKLGQERTQFMSCKDLKEEIEKSLVPDAEFIDSNSNGKEKNCRMVQIFYRYPMLVHEKKKDRYKTYHFIHAE